MADVVSNHPSIKTYPLADVVTAVSIWSNIPAEELVGESRKKYLQMPRVVGYRVARECLGKPYTEIGGAFQRDHTTILWALKRWGNTEAVADGAFAILDLLARGITGIPLPKNIRNLKRHRPPIGNILLAASDVSGIALQALVEYGQDRRVSTYRFASYVVAHDHFAYTGNDVGAVCNRMPSAVLEMVRKHRDDFLVERAVAEIIERLADQKFAIKRVKIETRESV